MADKAIQDLPIIDKLEANDLLVVGDASNGYSAFAATGTVMGVLIREQAAEAINEIEAKVSEAQTSAEQAKSSETAAKQSEQNAASSAGQSATSAQESRESAEAAAESKDSAAASSVLSQSWAAGGTGTREGEDTNNAKYWAEQAHNAAGGGVSSFNGRTGFVMPQSGDYTPDMIGAIPLVRSAINGSIPVLTENGQLQSSGENFDSLAFKFLEGQEYKTKWLYGGKPVYTKLVSFGNIPNASLATVQHGIQNMQDVVFVSGSTSDRKNIPTMNYGGGSSFDDSIDIVVNNSVISIAAQRNRSSATAKIAIAYTKTTD